MQKDNEQKNVKSKGKSRKTNPILMIIIAVVLALLLLIVYPVGKHYLELGMARTVLREAKTVRLAAQATVYDRKARNTEFFDVAQKKNISIKTEEDIMKLSGAKGTIQYVEYDRKEYWITEFQYIEDSYCAIYTYDGEEPKWTVYKLNQLLAF